MSTSIIENSRFKNGNQDRQQAVCYTAQCSGVRVSGGPQPVIVLPTVGVKT
jgi:hypothetical protein